MPRRPHPETEAFPAGVARQFRSLRLWQAVTILAVGCCVPLGFLLQASSPGSGLRSVGSTVLGLTIALAFVGLIGLAIAVFRQVSPPAIEYLRHKPERTTDNDAPTRRLPLSWAWTISIAAPAAVALAFWSFPHERPL